MRAGPAQGFLAPLANILIASPPPKLLPSNTTQDFLLWEGDMFLIKVCRGTQLSKLFQLGHNLYNSITISNHFYCWQRRNLSQILDDIPAKLSPIGCSQTNRLFTNRQTNKQANSTENITSFYFVGGGNNY